MRLLETFRDKLRPQDFQSNIPSYAILCHTWAPYGTEAIFANLKNGLGREEPGVEAAGYDIIFDKQARRDDLQYF
jgi:hypothetical protein